MIFTELSCGQLERISGMSAEAMFAPLASLGYTFDVVEFAGGLVSFGSDVARLAGYARAHVGPHVDVRCTPGAAAR